MGQVCSPMLVRRPSAIVSGKKKDEEVWGVREWGVVGPSGQHYAHTCGCRTWVGVEQNVLALCKRPRTVIGASRLGCKDANLRTLALSRTEASVGETGWVRFCSCLEAVCGIAWRETDLDGQADARKKAATAHRDNDCIQILNLRKIREKGQRV